MGKLPFDSPTSNDFQVPTMVGLLQSLASVFMASVWCKKRCVGGGVGCATLETKGQKRAEYDHHDDDDDDDDDEDDRQRGQRTNLWWLSHE